MAIPADLGDMLAAAAVAGYLLGSLPFGFLVARSRGVDIFQVGSRSPGATNVRRVLGRGPGNAVFVLDLLKGAVAAGWPLAWAYLVLAHESGAGHAGVLAQDAASREHMLGYVGLASALAGHSFSCFTGFRGGKGVATAAGGLLVLMPLVAIGSAAVWLVVFLAARYVSLASILAAVSLPVLTLALARGAVALCVTGLIAAFVVFRHRANVRRLLNGTEKKFERRKPGGAPPEGKP
jgi:glycerol-3-phosphate acyltransferase PlsY